MIGWKLNFCVGLACCFEVFLRVGDSLIPVLLCRAPLQPPQGPLETPVTSCHRVRSFCREIWLFLKHRWGCTSYKGEGEFQQWGTWAWGMKQIRFSREGGCGNRKGNPTTCRWCCFFVFFPAPSVKRRDNTFGAAYSSPSFGAGESSMVRA